MMSLQIIFLKDIKFSGKLMVMSAYNTVDNIKRIRSLGNIDIFSKPFNVEWFKRKLIDLFSKEEEVLFESIDLMAVMQVVNLERKTSAVQIDINGETGFIYFQEGEIISAEFAGIRDEEAIMKVMSLNKGSISIKKLQNKVKKTMGTPFVALIMDLFRKMDEHRKKQGDIPAGEKKEKIKIDVAKAPIENKPGDKTTVKPGDHAANEMGHNTAVRKKLAILKEVSGYLAAGVFTSQGEMLEGEGKAAGLDMAAAGTLIHDTLLYTQNMSREAGFGEADMIQVDTGLGFIFCKCFDDGKRHFHTVLIIKRKGNVAMAKMKLIKTVEELVSEF